MTRAREALDWFERVIGHEDGNDTDNASMDKGGR